MTMFLYDSFLEFVHDSFKDEKYNIVSDPEMEDHRRLRHHMGSEYSNIEPPLRDYCYEIRVEVEDNAPSPSISESKKFYFRSSTIKAIIEDLEKLEQKCGKIFKIIYSNFYRDGEKTVLCIVFDEFTDYTIRVLNGNL